MLLDLHGPPLVSIVDSGYVTFFLYYDSGQRYQGDKLSTSFPELDHSSGGGREGGRDSEDNLVFNIEYET